MSTSNKQICGHYFLFRQQSHLNLFWNFIRSYDAKPCPTKRHKAEKPGCEYKFIRYQHRIMSLFDENTVKLIRQADIAKYAAKTGGKIAYIFYHPDMLTAAS